MKPAIDTFEVAIEGRVIRKRPGYSISCSAAKGLPSTRTEQVPAFVNACELRVSVFVTLAFSELALHLMAGSSCANSRVGSAYSKTEGFCPS